MPERLKILEAVLDQSTDGVIVLDQQDSLIVSNLSARSAFGIHEEDLAGRPATEVFTHPDLLVMLSSENRGKPYRSEIALEDGRVLSAQSTPIRGVGLAIMLHDITGLIELDRIKSDFVNNVAHDLRSPLTAILGYVELLDRVGPVNAEQLDFIRRIQAGVHSITELINDLLDLGRIEEGLDTHKEPVSLGAIMLYTMDSLRDQILDKQQELGFDIPPDLPFIYGNPIRLRQMLANLLGNAVKYTPQGGQISLRALAQDGQVILQVADNGPGIPTADQPYIFDKFYRGSNVHGTTPGTGLGLAIVKSIVEDHQGRIWLDSIPGQGSTFTIVFPTAKKGKGQS